MRRDCLLWSKPPMILHQAGKRHFAGMAEGRVTQIVREADRFDQVLVAAQGAGQRPADLGNFQGVGEAGAEVVAFVVDEDLGLVFQPAEGGGVQDAVAVALEGGAVFRLVVQIGAALGVPAAHAVGRKAFVLDLFELLAGEEHGYDAISPHCLSSVQGEGEWGERLWGERGSNPHGVSTDRF